MNTGEDLENMLAENGGLGDFEEPGAAGTIQRWLFPRFDGALSIGTYSDENGNAPEGHEGTHVADDNCGENWAADPGNMYLSRSGLGPYDTDVETVVGWMSAPRTMVGAVNLISEPGTGKTALIEAAATHAEAELMTWLCTPDDTRDSLSLRFVGEGQGDCMVGTHVHGKDRDDFTPECERSPYTLGAIPFAAKWGMWLYLDEWMMLVDGVKPMLYALADGRRYMPGGNVDGSPLEIHPDFRLILSSNPLVRGASMPEPMASRCASTTLVVATSAEMLRDLGIDESVVGAWKALGEQRLFRPAIRELRLADYWLNVDPAQAVSAFLPEHCPESDRGAVRNAVVTFLGGTIREDGRLVVS